MSHVKDLWTVPGPDGGKRVHGPRWGKGKRWQARWYENGNQVTRSFGNKSAAQAFLAKTNVEQDSGSYIPSAARKTVVRDMWTQWIATKADKAPSTVAGYKASWKHIEAQFGDTACQQIDRVAFTTWLMGVRATNGSKEVLSASVRRNIGIVMNGLLDLAVEQHVIPSNQLKRRELPRIKQTPHRYLSAVELKRLLEACPHHESYTALLLLSRTGLRPGEAFGLRGQDLDVARKRLTIQRAVDGDGKERETKTYRHREVPISGRLVALLTPNAQTGKALLRNPDGKAWTRTRWRKLWPEITAKAGLDGLDMYELRHTAASLAIHAGANVKTVQRMLGHASAKVTLDVYAHLWDDELDTLPETIEAFISREEELALGGAKSSVENGREHRGNKVQTPGKPKF